MKNRINYKIFYNNHSILDLDFYLPVISEVMGKLQFLTICETMARAGAGMRLAVE